MFPPRRPPEPSEGTTIWEQGFDILDVTYLFIGYERQNATEYQHSKLKIAIDCKIMIIALSL